MRIRNSKEKQIYRHTEAAKPAFNKSIISAVERISTEPKYACTVYNRGSENVSSGTLTTIDENLPFWDVVSLAAWLDADFNLLSYILYDQANVNSCYSTFYIDKDSKKVVPYSYGLKLREINSPHPGLKDWLQKLAEYFKGFPCHPANFAFVGGRKLKDAVESVKDGDTLIHIDLHDFFGGNTTLWALPVFEKIIKERYGCETIAKNLAQIFTRLCFLNNKLPQGAPTSPVLTVILNYDFDSRIEALAAEFGMSYTRYADDLLFSGNIDTSNIHKFIGRLGDEVHPHTINWDKLNIMRERTYPIFRGMVIQGNTFIPSSQLGVLTNLLVQYLRDKLNLNYIGGDYKLKQNAPCITVEFLHNVNLPLSDLSEFLNEFKDIVIHKYPRLEETLKVRPIFFYIQSVKSALGLHITNNTVKYPRRKYRELRLQAVLMGRQRALQRLKHRAFTTGTSANLGTSTSSSYAGPVSGSSSTSTSTDNIYRGRVTSSTNTDSISVSGGYSYNNTNYSYSWVREAFGYGSWVREAFGYGSGVTQDGTLSVVLNRVSSDDKSSRTRKKFRDLLRNPFNRKVFNGKVAYLASIDPAKAETIRNIERKAYEKCLTEAYHNLRETKLLMVKDLASLTVDDTIPLLEEDIAMLADWELLYDNMEVK